MALTPANDMTPTHLANRAKELAADAGLEFDVLDEDEMQAKGMGLLLGVSRGSDEPATLSVMRYEGDPGSTEMLALVGKGLTFDSGGISIKPAENMHEMKYDMSGGAGVIARDVGDRQAAAQAQRDRPRAVLGEPARPARDEARRRPARR